ncbi:TolC family protein [Catalinimonas niigatensis]|uniref:TolC family protein n=1 Tax=Catalinimonas niigatensis TaxID=1397264 RepID=UPI00266616EB|nr:TolC family protein [Catalinimonas niigatensis]WPP51061.1 TolC family protein [Catalinimonas niigatensis]
MAQDENLQLTYEEAVNIALRENIQIKQQENILETSRAERAQAYAQFLPSVNARATFQRQIGRVPDPNTFRLIDATSDFVNMGLEASYNIFNGFANINQLRYANKATEAQFYQINSTKQEVIFNVSQQYLQVLLNQELLRIARSNLEQQNELAESIKIFVEAGTRNIADQYNQEAEAKRAALTVVESENQLTVSKVKLIRILQIDPFKSWQFAEPSIETESLLNEDFDMASIYNSAIGNRPDLSAQQLTVEANQYQLRFSKSNYFPSLTFGYSYGTRYSSNDDAFTFNEQITQANLTHFFSLGLFIPIFQNLQNRTLVQRSKQLLSNSMLDLEDLERNIFEQVQTAIADYETAQERIVAAESQVRAAEKALEAEKERFRLGVGNVLDLNRVNAAYVEALSTKAQADYQIIFQKTALDYYQGTLQKNSSGL